MTTPELLVAPGARAAPAPCAACRAAFAPWDCVLCGAVTASTRCATCLARDDERAPSHAVIGAGATCGKCTYARYLFTDYLLGAVTWRSAAARELATRYAGERTLDLLSGRALVSPPSARRPQPLVAVALRNLTGWDLGGGFGDALELDAAGFTRLARPGQRGALWIYVLLSRTLDPAEAQRAWLARDNALNSKEPTP